MKQLFSSKKSTPAPPRSLGRRFDIKATSYTSNPVHIPPEFLVKPAHDSTPITVEKIDFAQTTLPEYKGLYAVVLANVLSPSECEQLLKYAEESAPDDEGSDSESGEEKRSPWKPALVNMGGNFEARIDDYRKSERIIWDQQEIVNRIVDRCMQVIGEDIRTISPTSKANHSSLEWQFTRGNERMRFLRYEKGMFFQEHCDGHYASPADTEIGKPYERTFYTLHLYLNGDGVNGGETTFWGNGERRRLDVKAVQGRVLVFQHRGLLHSGEEVKGGVKFTMRTDLLYKRADLDEA